MTRDTLESVVDEVKTAEVSDEYGPGNERWEMRPLSELMEPVLGKTPKRSEDEYWGGDIQWASAKDISQSETRHIYDTAENMTEAGKEASNAKILPEGTVVVIARGATMGRVAQLGVPMTFNQTCYALDTNDELLDDYLYYAWQYVFGQVQAVSYGTVFDTITMKSFKDIEIPVPPLEIQKEIANYLTHIDDKIENDLQTMKSLEAVGDELFERLIVERSKDNDSNNRYKAFSEIADFPDGRSFDKEEWSDVGKPIIKISELNSGIDSSSDRYEGEVEEVYDLSPGDVLFAWSASLGVYLWKSNRGVLNQHIYNVLPKDGFSKPFLYFSLRYSMGDFLHRSHGTTTKHINRSDLDEVKSPVGTDEHREQFKNQITPIFEKAVLCGTEVETLDEMRDTLLPKLLSGAVRIPE
ncbi:restriction endonuclease subunit S [Halobacterium salinarum]|uniref:restriction endonuclease subunit S n=1 Tax=Halobacterium salinarum TaxID=2242 RepID=UPI00255401C1|nr:restriction endonuclease subunit S [Halobacterium salinarum]MDL0145835.1 restriction endonuclease subunit S [Halobacterium salinarum]